MNCLNSGRPFTTQAMSQDKPTVNPHPFDHSACKPNGKTSEQQTVAQDMSEPSCFSCHQKGHIVSSPKCPNFQQTESPSI